jgi:hypothetical protein
VLAVIGFVAAWSGYTLGYYGYNRITGGNNTLKQLWWPGAYTAVSRDSGGSGAPAPPPAAAAAAEPPPNEPKTAAPATVGLGGSIRP